jgi:ribosomal silencing factor RsfS
VNLTKLPQAVRLVVEAMQNKKGSAIIVLDLSSLGTFTEYFVVCTGFSTPQVQAICSEVEEQLYKELRREPEHREGRSSADCYYDLERLWRNVPRYEIPDLPNSVLSGQDSSRRRASGDHS